ncbi:energy transducer TonB [Megasphaera sp. DISK 18]|uniref:energy transducer TonB n=1 Tax=Megasphaera sp. DISK 18 TaxID=1776081 RepID=UPI0008071B3B|nr:energy transducer TonB [Megasphaera sp. DISK 18]OBZ32060.1 hypothetical protein A0U42_02900 [Megasphaera sp. DISK 18]
MDSRISWKKAYGGSLVIHALVFGLFMCFLAGSVAHHEEEKMYVIDLDASELTGAGSGHAGGGGGGAANLFPDKLSDAAVAERRAQVEQASSALAAPSAISPVESAAANPSPTNSASFDGGGSAAGGEGSGSGSGTGSGEGSGSGSGYGSGSGSGSGDGIGDGEGYGEGSGSGQGSGDSGSDGTGTGAFDTDGFWSAVNANKTYPPMAVKRGLTGTVYVTVTLDGSGNCIGVSASGDGLLAKAATKAVYAACPYPNPTGGDITVNVPVTFELQ